MQTIHASRDECQSTSDNTRLALPPCWSIGLPGHTPPIHTCVRPPFTGVRPHGAAAQTFRATPTVEAAETQAHADDSSPNVLALRNFDDLPEGRMSRSDSDSWYLKTGVGATATMVAAARAVASKQHHPLINDPYAGVLVRAVGLDLFSRIVDGTLGFGDIGASWIPPLFATRTRRFDDLVIAACRTGIRQGVILASGLDSRAYRLHWPPAMSLYEVDQPEVLGWKQDVLSRLAWTSAARHRLVGIDLRRDWPTALQNAGFGPARPTVWIVEGLLIGYLPPNAHDDILDAITALSASGSQMMADYFAGRGSETVGDRLNKLHETWSKVDPTFNMRGVTFPGERQDLGVFWRSERG